MTRGRDSHHRAMRALFLLPILTGSLLQGCAAIRYGDWAMPGLRLDRATNRPLPALDAPPVAAALKAWSPSPRHPTAYHAFVDTPAPGSFEGDACVGITFSGGGTRGMVFAAACVDGLRDLGAIRLETPEGAFRISPLDEVDYVAGVSTGAIPAAAFALNASPKCPEHLRFPHWPDCFNRDMLGYGLAHLALRPDRIARDLLFEMNTRPALAGTFAALFFDGCPYGLNSGLAFADLSSTPILLLGATVINAPGAAMVQSRLPYRYTLDEYPDVQWGVGIQSFETFHADPMPYSLAEACYNSSSFPGHARSGLLKVQPDQEWVYTGLDDSARARMRRARTQPGYEGTYEIKDGGLVDNRGIALLDPLFTKLAQDNSVAGPPLIIALDADYRDLRPAAKGSTLLHRGWLKEIHASSNASWQTGQDAHEELFRVRTDLEYHVAWFEMTAWTPFALVSPEESAEAAELVALCAAEPLIGDRETLLETLRGIGTTVSGLSEERMAALRVAARFAVRHEQQALLDWAAERYSAKAQFELQ